MMVWTSQGFVAPYRQSLDGVGIQNDSSACAAIFRHHIFHHNADKSESPLYVLRRIVLRSEIQNFRQLRVPPHHLAFTERFGFPFCDAVDTS